MNKLSCKMNRLLLLFIVMMLISCDSIVDSSKKDLNDPYFIELKSAKEIAMNISFHSNANQELKKGTKNALKNEIKHIEPISDETGAISFYVINYEDGGFLLLSADNRNSPVLAFSNENEFGSTNEDLPEGLTDWISEKKAIIKLIRDSKRKQTNEERKAWDLSIIQAIVSQNLESKQSSSNGSGDVTVLVVPPNDPGDCTPQFTVKNPLISTFWNQHEGFNGLMPFANCTSTLNGNKLVGCVGISIAQILYFYKHGSVYDWSQIPIYGYTNETDTLVFDAAESVNTVYGCTGSTAHLSAVAGAFKNTFGYSYADYSTSFTFNKVKTSLNNNRPVILGGGNHAWISDGYQEYITCPDGNVGSQTFVHLYMKWGWENIGINGWYAIDNWVNTNGNFNTNKQLIYNIKP